MVGIRNVSIECMQRWVRQTLASPCSRRNVVRTWECLWHAYEQPPGSGREWWFGGERRSSSFRSQQAGWMETEPPLRHRWEWSISAHDTHTHTHICMCVFMHTHNYNKYIYVYLVLERSSLKTMFQFCISGGEKKATKSRSYSEGYLVIISTKNNNLVVRTRWHLSSLKKSYAQLQPLSGQWLSLVVSETHQIRSLTQTLTD